MLTPIAPKPRSIIAQVAGSGTAPVPENRVTLELLGRFSVSDEPVPKSML